MVVLWVRRAAESDTHSYHLSLHHSHLSLCACFFTACLALATARLGSTGAWQSGILYLTYTASALLGATYIVKQAGARNALWFGMTLYCAYVACFWVATTIMEEEGQRIAAWTGAGIGGIGAGFLWTAQGAYFAQSAQAHAQYQGQEVSVSTSYLAGIFAFFYLAEEVVLRILSTILAGRGWSWESIFGLYTVVTVLSTAAMPLVYNFPNEDDETDSSAADIFNKVTAAVQLLWKDPKMKHMVGLNAVFGFASAFLNSYVNGQVLPVALDEKYIGVLSAWVSGVAAIMSLVFGKVTASSIGKGPVLVIGACCFFGVVFPFVLQPNASAYGWGPLGSVYTLHGVGRATFEGTLKATFADYFAYEKEGAFANIILQNGLAGAIGYVCK